MGAVRLAGPGGGALALPAFLDQFHEHTAEPARMHERDHGSVRAGSGRLVHQRHARRAKSVQGLSDVRDTVADVMQAFAPSGEEPADGGVRAQSPEQLDVGGPDPEQDFLHPLVLHPLAVDGLDGEGPPVLVLGSREVPNRDADVVYVRYEELGIHPRD